MRPFVRRCIVVALVGLTALPALADDDLVNASFEDGLAGWTLATGATTGDGGAVSTPVAVTDTARDGKTSLRFTGTPGTTTWQMLSQPLSVVAGQRVSLRVAARCRGLVREGTQYANGNGFVAFFDASGNRLAFLATAVVAGDREWVDLGQDVLAPPGTARGGVGVFASMTGSAWFDDVRVAVAPGDDATTEGRAAALGALESHLRRSWPFWGLDGKPDAGALFARHREAVTAAAPGAPFVDALRTLLAELNDVHVWIDHGSQRIGTAAPGPGAQFSLPAVMRRVRGAPIVRGRNVLGAWIGKGDERVGYLLVASFSLPEDELALVDHALDTFREARGIVVDVRPNGGGDERQAMALAARLAQADVVYARQVWRDPTIVGLTGFGPPQDRLLRAASDERRMKGRVAVLAGPGCVSSTEGFLAMAKALPRVTVVGQPSRGASGNPAAFAVVPGVTVWSSRWRSLDLEGACIEGVGVPPDERVAPSEPDPSGKNDAVLDRALELLRE